MFALLSAPRGGGQKPSGGAAAPSQLLALFLAKSGAWACKCSVTALRTNPGNRDAVALREALKLTVLVRRQSDGQPYS